MRASTCLEMLERDGGRLPASRSCSATSGRRSSSGSAGPTSTAWSFGRRAGPATTWPSPSSWSTSAERHDKRLGYGRRFYDLGRAGDQARVLHDFVDAEQDAGETSERVKADMRDESPLRASSTAGGSTTATGTSTAGGSPPELIGQEPEPEEAEVVAEVFRRFAAGDSGRGIAADLNQRGILQPKTHMNGERVQRPWDQRRIRRMIGNPHYIGKRVYNGTVIEGVERQWPALVTDETLALCRGPRGGPPREHSRDRQDIRYLLTGIARCGLCGDKLYRGHDRNRRNTYVCRGSDPERGLGIGHLSRDMSKLDMFVTEEVLRRLERGDVELPAADGTPEAQASRSEAARLRAKLAEAKDAWRANKLTALAYGEMEAELLPAISRGPTATPAGRSYPCRSAGCWSQATSAPCGTPGAADPSGIERHAT